MLKNISFEFYPRFKAEGYRLAAFKKLPVTDIACLAKLGYLDVCRTIRGIEEKQKNIFLSEAVGFLKRFLQSPPSTQQNFDELHQEGCEACIIAGKHGKADINYGQAQKIINMSLKYLYNEYAVYPMQNYFDFPLTDVENYFHLPIDSQIKGYLVGPLKFCSPSKLPWSRWSYDHYMDFQIQLRRRMKPGHVALEIDYLIWNTDGPSVVQALA